MCEDWITEKYIDDVRNANQKNYAAIKRVMELAKKFESESADEMVSYNLIADRIYTALGQEKK
jgi:imidazole glycerol phosphate synthase subunit HisF